MNEIKFTKEDANNAKAKLNNFFLNYFKKAIINQMDINGGSFLLGEFPYWQDESKFEVSIGKSFHFKIENIKGTQGGINGFIHYELEFFNFIYDTYKILLIFEFYGDSDGDCDNDIDSDYININSIKDLEKIKYFSISYFNFYEHSQILLSEELMSDFENLLFLRTLRG